MLVAYIGSALLPVCCYYCVFPIINDISLLRMSSVLTEQATEVEERLGPGLGQRQVQSCTLVVMTMSLGKRSVVNVRRDLFKTAMLISYYYQK